MSHSLTNYTINVINFLFGPSMAKFVLTSLPGRLISYTIICATKDVLSNNCFL